MGRRRMVRERKVPSDGIGIPLVLLCKQACNGYACWVVGDNHGAFTDGNGRQRSACIVAAESLVRERGSHGGRLEGNTGAILSDILMSLKDERKKGFAP